MWLQPTQRQSLCYAHQSYALQHAQTVHARYQHMPEEGLTVQMLTHRQRVDIRDS